MCSIGPCLFVSSLVFQLHKHIIFSLLSTKTNQDSGVAGYLHILLAFPAPIRRVSMAKRAVEAGLVLVFVTMLWAGAFAQSSKCANVLMNLVPCLDYVAGNSSTPSSQCCSQLAVVVQSSPECLCEVIKGGGSSLGSEVNQTQAMALPAACNVQTPPLSRCNAASPSDSPTGAPSGDGSKTVPSTQGGPISDGSSIKTSLSLLVFLVSAASCISIFKTY